MDKNSCIRARLYKNPLNVLKIKKIKPHEFRTKYAQKPYKMHFLSEKGTLYAIGENRARKYRFRAWVNSLTHKELQSRGRTNARAHDFFTTIHYPTL